MDLRKIAYTFVIEGNEGRELFENISVDEGK
jgi:hypothetical protein